VRREPERKKGGVFELCEDPENWKHFNEEPAAGVFEMEAPPVIAQILDRFACAAQPLQDQAHRLRHIAAADDLPVRLATVGVGREGCAELSEPT
jgi:hypothetical protein